MLKNLFIFIFLIGLGFNINAQPILPYSKNYNKQAYKGDNQTWSLVQGNDHAIYLANNKYFLRYNGVVWEKYTLPNQTIIRSVFAYNDIVFTGSYNEFGFWKRINGKMEYTSLVPSYFFKQTNSEEVWKILYWKGKIYFQTFSEMYVYDFKSVSRIKFPHNISYCFIVEDHFYITTIEDGIYTWDEKQFFQVSKWNALKGKIVHGIEKMNDQLFFFTQKSGVYVEKNQILTEWNNPLNTKLKSELINTTKLINNEKLLIGTSSNGLYIFDFKDNTYSNINKNSSLQNNSVLSIALDREDDIWLGLDNGITFIAYNSPNSIFTDKTGELGSVYAIMPIEKGYLLGSNHGLFIYENRQLKFIENSQGQVWYIYKQDQKYIIGHNDGTLLYENNKIEKKTGINGGWKFKKDLYKDRFIQSNYTGLAFFDEIEHLEKGIKLEGFNAPIKDFVQISEFEIIASHNHKGLFLIRFNSKHKLVSVSNITQRSDIKEDYGVQIFQYKNESLYYINQQWYYFDKIDRTLKIHTLFNEHFQGVSEIIAIDDENFSVVKDGIFYIINHLQDKFLWHSISNELYEGRMINKEVKIVKDKEKYLLNLDDGFLILNNIKNSYKEQKIIIEGFYNDKLIDDNKIPNNKNVEIHIISEFFGESKNTLYYSVNQSIVKPLTENILKLNNVKSGTYHILIYENDGDKLKEIRNYSFKVKMPWYLSIWMIFIYIGLLFFVLWMYYRWNKIRFIEKLKLKEEEMKHQSALIQLELESENKSKIQEYEKHILEHQVQLKANELAGKSLSLAKQTELIESIQYSLESENTVQSLKSKINKALKINRINKNEWKSFESNLFKSNEEFVKELTQKYRLLTSKDVKLCIYLKMNLSSKEIAPLMNISYRGVEIHRYRLRKKMGIPQEENLNTFMNNL